MSVKQQLEKITKHDVKRFTLDGTEALAKVVSVYDGDTCDVVFYHDDMEKFVRFKCRLTGYDAPELNKENGELTRDYLAHLCMGNKPNNFDDSGVWEEAQLQYLLDKSKNTVYAVFGKYDKYGRPLLTLKTRRGGMSINEMVRDFIVDFNLAKWL